MIRYLTDRNISSYMSSNLHTFRPEQAELLVVAGLGRLSVSLHGISPETYQKYQPGKDFDRVVAVNLRGTFLACQEAMKRMAPAGDGCIINIASVVGLKGYVRQGSYTASKHGVQTSGRRLHQDEVHYSKEPHGDRM